MSIVSHYESCLKKFGDSHQGVDWPDENDVETRYRVMLDLIKSEHQSKVSLLDFGCGASHLYEHIVRNDMSHIDYSGLDISKDFIQLSQEKYPLVNYYCLDILDAGHDIDHFDYVVLNGVFTEKRGLSFDEMLAYFKSVVAEVYLISESGIAFNVMSSHVDWEREDLFHLPLDILTEFLVKNVSRNFIIRNDYGLYEYTVYIYK
jgi:SAM-dependent methyltransferase